LRCDLFAGWGPLLLALYERRPRRDHRACRSCACAATIALQAALLHDAYELTVFRAFLCELDLTLFFRKQRVVATDADIFTGVKTRAALTNNNVAGNNVLTAVDLDAQAFTF